MGWEKRKGRPYYYSAERIGGRVVKRYVGGQLLGELAAEADRLASERRKMLRADRELARDRWSELSPAGELLDAADAVLARWLSACGWHRPHRGAWRRKRGFVMEGEMAGLAGRRPLDSWDTAELWRLNGDLPAELTPKEGKPKPAAVATYLADHPAAVALYGDLGRRVVARLADAISGTNALASAAVQVKAADLRLALAGDTPNPVELLLAERAVVCWAVCHQYEMLYYGSLDKGREIEDHDFHERRIGAAHRRFLSSIKALAEVRRLKLPDLLAVVHVAGGNGTPTPRPATASVSD